MMWAALAGLAELAGGLIGQIILWASEDPSGAIPDDIYGVLFGSVCGVVSFLSAVDFIPNALALDDSKGNWKFLLSFAAGMVFISATLVFEQA